MVMKNGCETEFSKPTFRAVKDQDLKLKSAKIIQTIGRNKRLRETQSFINSSDIFL